MANDCQDVLTNEMEAIQVEFKLYEEYNKLAEKTETKWTSLNSTFITFISACMYFAKWCKSCNVVTFFKLVIAPMIIKGCVSYKICFFLWS